MSSHFVGVAIATPKENNHGKFGLTHGEAKALKKDIERYLRDEMKLELSKFHIDKIKKGINFVGFRTWRSTRFVRKRSLHNFRKALKRGNQKSLVSIVGNARRTATYAHFKKQLRSAA